MTGRDLLDAMGVRAEDARVVAAYHAVAAYAAATDLPVLILGDPGTGKEMIARGFARGCGRDLKEILDCSVLSLNLIEAELFGHKKGAFTGATRDQRGAFERADGGVIFLDELGELPLELQAKLLRVIQHREVKRLGCDRVRRVDVRIVAATNRNLADMVAAGEFRRDLFDRLHMRVELPTLDQRSDLLAVAEDRWAWVWRRSPLHEGEAPPLPDEARRIIAGRSWPGNVRELEGVLAKGLALGWGSVEPADSAGSERVPRKAHHPAPESAPPRPGKRTTPAPESAPPRPGKRTTPASSSARGSPSGRRGSPSESWPLCASGDPRTPRAAS